MLSKMKTSVVVAALMMAVSAYAKDTNVAAPAKINIAAIQASLSELPAVEIPVKASEMMKAASKEAKLETAKAILKSVLEQRPQMAIQLVASLVKASPESASQISTLALAIVPQYGNSIIRAAAVNAPPYAGEIAAAAVTAFPALQVDIVNWVSLAVPSQSEAVASAVDRQSVQNTYVRLISNALAQFNSGGNIASTKATLSNILASNPVLQNQLVQGFQEQVKQRQKAEEAAQVAAAANNGATSFERVVKEVTLTFDPITKAVVVKEKIISKVTVPIIVENGQPSADVDNAKLSQDQSGVGEETELLNTTPADFPDVAEVAVQPAQPGADNSGREEQKVIEDLLKANYNL